MQRPVSLDTNILFSVLLNRKSGFAEILLESEHRRAAYALCSDIDETDTPHVALALELDGALWTGDNTLKSGLERKGFERFFEPGM